MTASFPKVSLKRVSRVTLGKMLQSVPGSEDDVSAPYMRAAHVQPGGRLVELDEQPMWFSGSELAALQLRAEDVVMVEGGAGYGRSAYLAADLPGWGFQNSILRLRRDPARSLGAFIHYALQAALDDGQIATACNQATFAHFTAEKVAAFEIPVPPVPVQAAVISFLDREAAEIDAFIADQEELVGLLAERRAATISHAVTKGLDSSVPMRDGGSAWFPILPAPWQLMPIGLGSTLIQTGPFGSQLHSDEYVENGVPLINPMHIVDGKLRPSPGMSVSDEKAAELHRHSLRSGDIVVARRGELGRCAVTAADEVGYLCGTGSAIIRLNCASFVPEYFQLAFSSEQARHALLQYSIGSTMDNLNSDVVAALRIPCPPVAEQRQIVDYLNHEAAELDAAIADAREAIALSRERRAALISAAVTGKIDVCEAA